MSIAVIIQVSATCSVWGIALIIGAAIASHYSDATPVIAIAAIGFGLLLIAALGALVSVTGIIWMKGIAL